MALDLVENLVHTFPSHAAIPQNALVSLLNTGKVQTNALNGRPIGVALRAATAADQDVPVRLLHPAYRGIASEAFAVGALLYTESDGELQDTAASTSHPIGIALTAAAADQDEVLWLPIHFGGAAAT